MKLGKKKTEVKVIAVAYCEVCGVDLDEIKSPNEARIWCEADDEDTYKYSYWNVDICAQCFADKVIPILENAGIKVRKRGGDDVDKYLEEDEQFPLKLEK